MEQSENLGLTAEELTSLWILRAEIQGEKSQIFSLHKHPCSFTCEDKLQQCSSSACGVLERNEKFPQTSLVSYHRSASCLCWEQVPPN